MIKSSISDLKQDLADELDREALGRPSARAKVGALSRELSHRLGILPLYPRLLLPDLIDEEVMAGS